MLPGLRRVRLQHFASCGRPDGTRPDRSVPPAWRTPPGARVGSSLPIPRPPDHSSYGVPAGLPRVPARLEYARMRAVVSFRAAAIESKQVRCRAVGKADTTTEAETHHGDYPEHAPLRPEPLRGAGNRA